MTANNRFKRKCGALVWASIKVEEKADRIADALEYAARQRMAVT
jgi:hypothetical protein